VVWVLNELDSTTTTYRWQDKDRTLTPTQVITTLPPEFTGYSTTAEIAVTPDGRFVYCSNRGHDSIAIYGADATSGILTPVGWEPTQDSTPRFIGLDPTGHFLFAAK
jgi:6-phosphogluconolactonase